MPPVELSSNNGENTNNQPTTIVPVPAAFVPQSVKAKIGIIYPPPEIRNIVDKTASFVARNGPSFESKVKEAEANNSKFNFLNPHDPYHAYYLHKVKEFMEGKAPMPGGTEQQQTIAPTPTGQQVSNKVQTKQSEISKFFEPIIIKDPPSEYEFMIDPPSISAYDLDVVKLTAQFVARNGRQFLTSLMSKEARNSQFDFLKPAHGLFNYFTKLVEQYTKILIPSKELLNRLSSEIDDQQKVMDEVNYRVEWVKHQLRERAKEEEAIEKERAAYSQIDWHDFVVVETVDYQPQEQGNFPPPTTPEMVGARMLLQERLDRNNFQHIAASTMMNISEHPSEMDMDSPPHSPPGGMASTVNMQEMDMEQDDEDNNVPPPPPLQAPQPPFPRGAPLPPVMISRIPTNQTTIPPPFPPGLPTTSLPPPIPTDKLPAPLKPQDVIIKPYNPKEKMVTINPGEQYLISPITKEKIPASSISSHTKYALLDPSWIQRREKELAEQQEKEQVYEPGSHVELELKKFAERRTDIFGTGAQETLIGRKIGEEDRRADDNKVQWDGHTSTAEKTSKKALAGVTMEDQMNALQRSQGLIEDDTNRIGPTIPKPQSTTTYSSTAKTIQKPPQLSPLITRPMVPMGAPGQRTLVATPIMRPGMQPVAILPQPPPTMVAMPSVVAVGPPQPPLHPPPQLLDEPASKRAKTEDQLIPEEEFYKTVGRGQVTITVQLPIVPEKPEWNLNGQAIPLTLPITDPISVIKAKLSDLLGGMPPGKQKLVYNDIFVKDSNSLGFYNMMKGSLVYLQLKERGGRKK